MSGRVPHRDRLRRKPTVELNDEALADAASPIGEGRRFRSNSYSPVRKATPQVCIRCEKAKHRIEKKRVMVEFLSSDFLDLNNKMTTPQEAKIARDFSVVTLETESPSHLTRSPSRANEQEDSR